MKTSRLRHLFCLVAFTATTTTSHFVRAEEAPDYLKEIKPILQRRCYNCHGALKQKGNLRLDTRAEWTKGGDSGSVIEPGKPDESLLLLAVKGAEGLQRMPLEGEPLSAEEIARLTAWIKAGAHAPDEAPLADPRDHWSFHPPQQPELPQVAHPEWQQNPIDAFIGEQHAAKGLKPAPLASKQILLRRLYLDLIGLPPTRKEMQDFLADTSDDAYEKVVDRLLASPHYGERWGRHWMDVWRYSDWDGYGAEIRESQAHIWRWRDWIVESLNGDRGYDQMVREMLAGDEIAPQDPATLRATGFLVRNYFRFNRHIWMDNTVEHTGKAFLGITFNCARCHDHMYDPIEQREYYQLRAIFEPYDVRTDRVGSVADVTKDGLVRAYDAHQATPTFLFVRGDDKQPMKDQPISPAFPKALGGAPFATEPVQIAPEAYYPGLRQDLQAEALAAADAEVQQATARHTAAVSALQAAQKRLTDFQANPQLGQIVQIMQDDFGHERPELWKVTSGEWNYRDGRLVQSLLTAANSEITAQPVLPRDFHAKLRIKIAGGQMWKSAGLSFDSADSPQVAGVYLSAFAGGPKVQVYTAVNGQHAYPSEGMKPLSIGLGEEHELDLFVRDRLLNVAVDGKLLLAYQLPQPRAPRNELRLFAFDAQVEFLKFQLNELSPETVLVESVKGDQPLPVSGPPTVESLTAGMTAAEAGVKVAASAESVAHANRSAVAARIEADRTQYANPVPAQAGDLARQAVQKERELALAKAQQAQLAAENAAAAARAAVKAEDEKTKAALTAAETKLAEATKAVEAAQGVLAQPLTEAYTRFGTVYPAVSSGRRLALANWITQRQNPLAARVAVNHMWLRHFHSPLVPSVFDFGLNGKAPTHPKLLDWLAVELMNHHSSVKGVHRLMVTSRTYRLMSYGQVADTANQAIDPENIYLWRANTHRMEAEIVRDSTLAVSGELDRSFGGPDLDPEAGLTVARRSLYFRNAKEKRVQFLAMFDSPNVVECYRRSETIVPQQALAMTNSPLTLAQARLLTTRLSQEVGSDVATHQRFIEVAFEQILSRPPTEPEVQQCLKFLESQTQRFADGKALTAFQAGTATHVPPNPAPHLRARENLVHVLMNHNDFVTVR